MEKQRHWFYGEYLTIGFDASRMDEAHIKIVIASLQSLDNALSNITTDSERDIALLLFLGYGVQITLNKIDELIDQNILAVKDKISYFSEVSDNSYELLELIVKSIFDGDNPPQERQEK